MDLPLNIPTWRYVRYLVPAVAAGATNGPVNVTGFDDNRRRRLTGIYVSGGGALQHTKVDVAGRVFVDIDHAMFGTGRGPLELDQVFEPGVIFSVQNVVDIGGVAIAANTVVVTLRYASDPITSPATQNVV